MPSVIEIHTETSSVPELSSSEMVERLLSHGVMGVEYPIGSDATVDPSAAFDNIVVPRAYRTGIATWVQQSQLSVSEGMNQQIYAHPEYGLVVNGEGRLVVINDERFLQLLALLEIDDETIDLHPSAAQGYWQMLLRQDELSSGLVAVKTQLSSPACSRSVLPDELQNDEFQGSFYRALMRGHVRQLRQIAPVVMVSVDNPASSGTEAMLHNFELMFGDVFENGELVNTAHPKVLRCYHDCNGPAGIELMRSRAVHVIHVDALLLGASPVLGNQNVLRDYIDWGGMFALGVVPQKIDLLVRLANSMGIQFNGQAVRSQKDYDPLAEALGSELDQAAAKTVETFVSVSRRIAAELTGSDKPGREDMLTVARHSFLSTTCGLGSLEHPGLRQFVYSLIHSTSNRIQNGIPL